MFTSIRSNKSKTFLIFICVLAFLAAVVYVIVLMTPYASYAIPIAILFSMFASVGSYYYSDKIVLKTSGAVKAPPEVENKLRNILEGLCLASGLPMPRFYIVNDPSPNAFATGRNPKNAVVCVTTGLLDTLDYYELEGVLAHEMSHIKNYDILLQTVAIVMVGSVGILASLAFRMQIFGMGTNRSNRRNGNGNGNSIQVIIMIIGLILMILYPIVSNLLVLLLSRNREYLADATSVQLTRNPEGLISALKKLESNSRPVAMANKCTASLYIVNPMKKKKNAGLSEIFMTHPPIDKRIAALQNFKF